MKTFLNVVGILAILAALSIMVASKSAVHEIEAGLSVLVSVISFGFASVLTKQTEAQSTLNDLGKVLVRVAHSLETVVDTSQGAASTPPPPVPGKERYFIADADGKPIGPHDVATLRGLLHRGAVTADAWVIKDGDTEWQKLGIVVKPG
jgi:hypothetical protein